MQGTHQHQGTVVQVDGVPVQAPPGAPPCCNEYYSMLFVVHLKTRSHIHAHLPDDEWICFTARKRCSILRRMRG